jgi:FMN phosphatase YigB (HAD superfamily)
MSNYKLGLFDVGWCLFDEDPRWWKTCCWMSDTLRGYDIFFSPEQIKIAYESCCSRIDTDINSITKQCLVELGLPDDVVKTLCKRHPWHTYDFYPYQGSEKVLTRMRMMGADTAILSNQGTYTRNVLVRHGFDAFCSEMILSAEEGMEKPNPAFFKFDVQPEEVLYFGDRLDHDIAGAQRVGIHAALVQQGPHRRQRNNNVVPDYTFRFISEVYDALCSVDGGGFRIASAGTCCSSKD